LNKSDTTKTLFSQEAQCPWAVLEMPERGGGAMEADGGTVDY